MGDRVVLVTINVVRNVCPRSFGVEEGLVFGSIFRNKGRVVRLWVDTNIDGVGVGDLITPWCL